MNTATSTSFFLFLLSSMLFLQSSHAAVSCSVVAMKAIPCVAFVTGKQPKPAPGCCSGLQQLAHGAVTVVDRRAICQCLESGVKAFPGVQDRLLSQIPAFCGIKIGFPVSLNTNCNKIN
ncbi:non-specific lipid-transfer protein D, cotyledon-specific isoform-like [Typha latifolia]|uniref:non-specific lipid-transfer protein D, cotyledon-specific isoform-like n=1 Tax=Typha latifolia TaxID=4733 RepID=UPI003C304DC3